MLKRCTLLVIVALCFAATSSAYEPLTPEEAREYVERFPAAAAEDVRALDIIENTEPNVEIPNYNVIVTDDEVIMDPRGPLVVEVGRLGWSITLPEQRAAYEPQTHNRLADIGASALVGFAVGVIVVLVAP
jgi:hypothetical protein